MKYHLVNGAKKFLKTWQGHRFRRVAQKVLNTTPLSLKGHSPTFLSMLGHNDIYLYLISLKSIYSKFCCGRVVILNDGSLTSSDICIIRHHVPGVYLIDTATIKTGHLPTGGCWERLVKAIELSDENYVIQFDSDTLVSGDIPEVIASWKDNKSFILGTKSGQSLRPAAEVAMMVQSWIRTNAWTNPHICVEAESVLDQLPSPETRQYVHASAGFAGFARSGFSISTLESFSQNMRQLVGSSRWSLWGTEQIASNYVLANSPNAIVLPFPRYACFEPYLEYKDSVFLHFIGSNRYDHGVYRRRSNKFLASYRGIPRAHHKEQCENQSLLAPATRVPANQGAEDLTKNWSIPE